MTPRPSPTPLGTAKDFQRAGLVLADRHSPAIPKGMPRQWWADGPLGRTVYDVRRWRFDRRPTPFDEFRRAAVPDGWFVSEP